MLGVAYLFSLQSSNKPGRFNKCLLMCSGLWEISEEDMTSPAFEIMSIWLGCVLNTSGII